MHYRLDSAQDVHVGFDLLIRYIEIEMGRACVLKEPAADKDINEFRGWDSINDDARLLADILGVYLTVADRHGRPGRAPVPLQRA